MTLAPVARIFDQFGSRTFARTTFGHQFDKVAITFTAPAAKPEVVATPIHDHPIPVAFAKLFADVQSKAARNWQVINDARTQNGVGSDI
jgi:hypothetical protein